MMRPETAAEGPYAFSPSAQQAATQAALAQVQAAQRLPRHVPAGHVWGLVALLAGTIILLGMAYVRHSGLLALAAGVLAAALGGLVAALMVRRTRELARGRAQALRWVEAYNEVAAWAQLPGAHLALGPDGLTLDGDACVALRYTWATDLPHARLQAATLVQEGAGAEPEPVWLFWGALHLVALPVTALPVAVRKALADRAAARPQIGY